MMVSCTGVLFTSQRGNRIVRLETWSDEYTMGISLWRRVSAVIVRDDPDNVPLYFGLEIHRRPLGGAVCADAAVCYCLSGN